MIPDRNMIASAVGGKTARACDYCVRNRARWYCAADDAFLCQLCDSSVHSANPLARRHERVRLKTASLKMIHAGRGGGGVVRRSMDDDDDELVPSWHRGLTRRPRTPRQVKQAALSMMNRDGKRKTSEIRSSLNPPPVVPQAGADDDVSSSHEDENEEEQLLYRVPILDPFVTHFCTAAHDQSSGDGSDHHTPGGADADDDGVKSEVLTHENNHTRSSLHQLKQHLDHYNPNGSYFLSRFDHVDMDDLADFAADVESLLGGGLDDQGYGMDDLGLLESCGADVMGGDVGRARVKPEDQTEAVAAPATTAAGAAMVNLLCQVEAADAAIDAAREPFELTFNYDTPTTCEEIKDVNHRSEERCDGDCGREQELVVIKKRKIELSLDYEAVSAAWAGRGSPWMNGERPPINLDDCWPQCLGGCGSTGGLHSPGFVDQHVIRGMPGGQVSSVAGDGGREARVSRYREKRRTRLFSKKIRYEVRKLNAEKRPRMKGRFVKRTSFLAGTTGPAGTTAAAATVFPLLAK